MNYPSTFRHDYWSYDKGEGMATTMVYDFRGKNAFGGELPQRAVCRWNEDGAMTIEIGNR